ncbi:MAG: membrane protein insertase YidC [Proteobacteria bacterium]|nr:membrane protein insertase YidC [Pseudomonadota bacterium]MBU1582910.1 membrane protein insertase YidC [Pseudomonadota bacterium]MBU2629448.1 membrane protein insertase YidC [Pseudomonadota bacterium]
MDEQKRLILAIVLSVVVLVGYQAFFVKSKDPNTLPQQVQSQSADQSQISEKSPNVSDYRVQPGVVPQPGELKKENFRTISVSTPLYNISISEQGAAIKTMELKNYKGTNKKDSPLKQLVPVQLESGTLFFDLEGQSIPGLKDAVYTAKIDTTETAVFEGEKTIEFVLGTAQGIVVKKVFTFRADSYMIDCDIVFQNGSALPLNDSLVISTPGFYNDEVKTRSRFAFEGPIVLIDEKYTAIDPDDIEEKNTYHGNIEWSGYTERYFMTVVMPKKTDDGSVIDSSVKLSFANDRVSNNYIQKMDRLDPGKQGGYSFVFYMGPKSQKVLSKYNNNLKDAINFGFFNVIAKPLLIGMNTIHNYIPNYGIAIILLTILIKLIFWPLGTKSYKSMNEMKKVQPLMMEIREKYKNDKQRMNQEVMGLYKTYKVNPAGGCLPMLVQMPIFFALYRMLYQAIELRHAPFLGWVSDLSAPDRLFEFNFAIPMMDEPYGIPMLTLLMGASFLLQQKMTPTGGDPMQAKMMMLMPIFMTVLFINFPAGLVLYMFVNNIISMGQQYYIQKKFSK